jgi:hypothetical protein
MFLLFYSKGWQRKQRRQGNNEKKEKIDRRRSEVQRKRKLALERSDFAGNL